MKNPTTDTPLGLLDLAGEAFFSFFSWSVTGLWKSALNYPDTRGDRWVIFWLSSLAIVIIALAIATANLAYFNHHKWWLNTLLAYAYFILSIGRLLVYSSQRQSNRAGFW